MLRVKSDDYELKLVDNGRGRWKELKANPQGYVSFQLLGFGGENQITIIHVGMQSGTTDVVIIYSSVDSNSSVSQFECPTGEVAERINSDFREHEKNMGVSL